MSESNEPLNKIIEAKQTWEHAKRALVKAVAETLPLGTIVQVTLGGHWITGRVVRHPEAWCDRPMYIEIENVITGKRRRTVCPIFNKLHILELPDAEGTTEQEMR